MTRYKTPNVRHNPPHRRHSKIYFLAKHLKIFALNDAEDDGVPSSDTIVLICLVLWISWLTWDDDNEVLTLFEAWTADPVKIFKVYNSRKVWF